MSVTRAERALVDHAVALVDGSDPRLHGPWLVEKAEPCGLSEPALAAVGRVVSRGVAVQIVRSSDPRTPVWRGQPLVFGSATLDLLSWLHASPITATPPELTLRAPIRGAEALIAARAAELVSAVGGAPPRALVSCGWVWLLAGAALAPHTPPPNDLDFAPVLADRWLLDALQRRLFNTWTAWARQVRAVDLQGTLAHGTAHEAVARGFLRACAAANRHEAAAFLVDQLPLLAALPVGVWEVQRADGAMADFQRARRARIALARAIAAEVALWERAMRAVGFVDDGYDQAQARLGRFEAAFGAARTLAPAIAAADLLPS